MAEEGIKEIVHPRKWWHHIGTFLAGIVVLLVALRLYLPDWLRRFLGVTVLALAAGLALLLHHGHVLAAAVAPAMLSDGSAALAELFEARSKAGTFAKGKLAPGILAREPGPGSVVRLDNGERIHSDVVTVTGGIHVQVFHAESRGPVMALVMTLSEPRDYKAVSEALHRLHDDPSSLTFSEYARFGRGFGCVLSRAEMTPDDYEREASAAAAAAEQAQKEAAAAQANAQAAADVAKRAKESAAARGKANEALRAKGIDE